MFLISGFTGKLGLEKFDRLNETFAEKEFNWEKIKSFAGKIFQYASRDDPYIRFKNFEALSRSLNSRLIVVEGAGHFNSKSGYNTFPELLNNIKAIAFDDDKNA